MGVDAGGGGDDDDNNNGGSSGSGMSKHEKILEFCFSFLSTGLKGKC